MTPFLFLGGTVGNSNWRGAFTQRLIAAGVSADRIYNPAVPDWTPAFQAAEDAAKREAEFNLFYLCATGQAENPLPAYSLVEAVMHLYDQTEKTIVVFDLQGLDGHLLKALQKSEKDLRARFPQGHIYRSADEALAFLSNKTVQSSASGGM